MDKVILTRIRTAVHAGDRSATSIALQELDREARATVSRDGDPRDDRAGVTLSLDDLVELLVFVAKPKTFGEAIREAGFRPATGARIATRQPHPMRRGPLSDPSKDD